ncbi:unnamed protein product [Aspergillus oryzae]|nr:unnamed protein product [Aspergillus oryzae]
MQKSPAQLRDISLKRCSVMEDAAKIRRRRVPPKFDVLEERSRRTSDDTRESNAGQGHPGRSQPIKG